MRTRKIFIEIFNELLKIEPPREFVFFIEAKVYAVRQMLQSHICGILATHIAKSDKSDQRIFYRNDEIYKLKDGSKEIFHYRFSMAIGGSD